jgi:UDP-glucose-4-epimerase GalE
MKVLITGGAGYIGTNLMVHFLKNGHEIVVVDDFVNAKEEYVEKLMKLFKGKISLYRFDVRDRKKLDLVFKKECVDGVIHLAAKKYVDESVSNPKLYLENNIDSLNAVLECMDKNGVNKVLFASSGVVYGSSTKDNVLESDEMCPLSPYAESKLEGEKILLKWAKSSKYALICRFSNPAGANTEYLLGDDSRYGKKNLIPYISEKVLDKEQLTFNGNNHPTRDGTPVRDYIHIVDMTKIVYKLFTKVNETCVCNVARGEGKTVLEIMRAFESTLNNNLNYNFKEKREGDASSITFSTSKLKSLVEYEYECSLDDIVQSQILFDKNKKRH